MAKVGILMGSKSDFEVVKPAVNGSARYFRASYSR